MGTHRSNTSALTSPAELCSRLTMLSTLLEHRALLELDPCPSTSAFYGIIGACAALIFSNIGGAYGTAKSGVGICVMGVGKPDLIWKSLIPVVMAGVRGIYGLIIAIIISNGVLDGGYSYFNGSMHLCAGMACGLSNLAAGIAIGVVGDYGVRASAKQPKIFVGSILILVFAEALGLYGLFISLVLTTKDGNKTCSA